MSSRQSRSGGPERSLGIDPVDSSSNDNCSTSGETQSFGNPGFFGIRCFGFVVLATACAIVFRYDFEISQFLRTTKLPSDLGKMILHSEVLSHGCGVVIVLGSLGWIDRVHRKQLWLLLVLALLSGLVVDVVKLGFPRIRPNSDFDSLVTTASDSWVNAEADMLNSRDLSFPSAHAAVGCCVCLGLARLYPAGWWIFLILYGMTGFQRVVCGAHYPTDVMAGMLIGGALTYTACRFGLLPGRVFKRCAGEVSEHQTGSKVSLMSSAPARSSPTSRVA